MNGGRCDASTSTEDVKGRPLCLFYFTHPFGVLSPDPPTVTTAPAHVARAFLNMQPVSPWWWAGNTASRPAERSAATGESFELGAATVHPQPIRLVREPRRDSLASSLLSELWFESCSRTEPRRLVPYTRILPPLRLPSARAQPDYSNDVWPRKPLHPEKFSLPPISLPPAALPAPDASSTSPPASGAGTRESRPRRRLGVDKQRRRRRAGAADVRRVLACLMRRAITERGSSDQSSPTPALHRVLATIRAAWTDPARGPNSALLHSRDALNSSVDRSPAPAPVMQNHEPAARPHASPGLLRRRYSVPETIMRKYRLAQQCSDSEESVPPAHQSVTSFCPSSAREPVHSACESPQRFVRRDRELMRKSALLRRLWSRGCPAPACCRCEEEARATRSLDGSRSELSSRRSPAPPWTSPKRQRLDTITHVPTDLSDSTFQSRFAISCAGTTTDTESRQLVSQSSSERLTERVTANTETEEQSPPQEDTVNDRSYDEYETLLSATLSTAKDTEDSTDAPRDSSSSNVHIEGRISERSAGVDNDDLNVSSYEQALTVDASPQVPLYELLEIVVSESADSESRTTTGNGASHMTALTLKNAQDINIDEYVSNILVESLNSLTDQLECMNASIGGNHKISIVEKEIKVRLQNTGVNTIVHLSPTSNNQIIFGNEELCNEVCTRDECNNPLSIRDERESNNNLSSSADTAAPRDLSLEHEPPQNDSVNRAVLQQIQKLFREEMRGLDGGEQPPPGVSHIEISNVDAYMEAQGAAGAALGSLEITTRSEGDPIAGVGAGNYFRDSDEALAVPRYSAYPHTESMEVNTSSSSDAEAVCSDCTSLVDSLDDPNSPRGVLLRRRCDLARSAVDVLELLPESANASAESRGEAFFVPIEDDRQKEHGNVTVAEYMPEKIKQRLYRRHRKRELRMECARRSKVKELKKELERRQQEEAAQARKELERECMSIVNSLIDDVIAKIAQDEYKSMRIGRRNGKITPARSEENLSRRARRGEPERNTDAAHTRRTGRRSSIDQLDRLSERNHIRGKLLARPSLVDHERPPRRIYQKSEIHEGEKCIEILEIIEYVQVSPSSPETTNSDENHNRNMCSRKSRIPIPVHEKAHKSSGSEVRFRQIGDCERRTSPPPPVSALAGLLLEALGEVVPSPMPAPPEPRSRSNSLRFKRVFDIIPEERSSLSFDSSAEDMDVGRRGSAPEVSKPPPTPAPIRVPAPVHTPVPAAVASKPPIVEKNTRSAGTSPLADIERVRPLRSQMTMTSPCSKSAATSPLRPPAPPRGSPPHAVPPRAVPPRPAPPRPAREGRGKEKSADTTVVSRVKGGERPAPRLVGGGKREERRNAPSRRRGGEERNSGCGEGSSSSDSGDSGGSLLCSLAPRWLSAHARSRRRARRLPPAAHTQPSPDLAPTAVCAGSGAGSGGAGGWTVTVAGSCRAALPADVEMRLRFPQDGATPAHTTHPAPSCDADPRLTLTMKKESQDSSVLASKSVRKSSELPELETYRASRTKLKSSVKTRRGYSLHCWLPEDEPAPIRASNGLSVLGCAIIPELKPRVPTMSERDLTRVYTPRHYLRS